MLDHTELLGPCLRSGGRPRGDASCPKPEARGGGWEELSDPPKPEAMGGGREELPHAPTSEARGSSMEDQPHAMAAQGQEGLEELSHVEGKEGRW